MPRFPWLMSLWSVSLAAAAMPAAPAVDKRIDADVHAVLQRTETPGAAIAVFKDGQLVYRQAYGLRDRDGHLPASVDTWFEIGSITKQFTAAAILQLQEAGKLTIDAKLATYLPDAPHANEVTLRQLLSHTSGLPEYVDGPDIEQAATRPATFDQLVARIKDKPLDFAPGSRWSYSNTGYLMLGRVIEVVSQESYRHYVQTHLLDSAGLTQTFTVADEAHLPVMAIGYRHAQGRLERAPTIHDTFGWAAGNLVSTLGDLQKWNQALMGGKIVSPADYALMSTSVMTTEKGSADYGLGLFVDSVEGQPRVGHTGGSFGFTTANEYFPKQGVRIIAFTNNGDNPEPGEMLTTAIFNELYPEIYAAMRKPAAGEDTAMTAAARATFTQLQGGSEDSSRFGAKLDAKLKAGLSARLAKQFSPYGAPTAFVFKGRRVDGAVTWFDYLIQFGPGSILKFGLGIDQAGKVASLSFG
ncbi:beta-lactamase family protein [Dyella halodurans]|uniref:Serine hydrolase domain-containing protein n=1 Tax=Dyella halodurans TaxID=1920171 RepID=A0ABV9C1X3_9GAMM|nr:serine hydrolase domain-containing protein [Dyella halodurans]